MSSTNPYPPAPLNPFSLSEFETTETDERDIAAAAHIGFSRTPKNG